jgi:hypothetical protein
MKTIFGTRLRLAAAAAVSGLALIGAFAFGAPSARATTGPASPSGVQPMAAGNIFNSASGKCLGTSAGHNNTYTVLWTCNGSRNQSWAAGPASPYNGAYVMIKNENGDCLGLSGGQVAQGTPVMAWQCQPGAKNQYWFYMWELGPGGVNLDVLCNLLQPCTHLNTGRVAGVAGGGVSNGARIVLWDNDGHQDQDWYCATGISC